MTDAWLYLVADHRGQIAWVGTSEERANELASNTGLLVARVPIVADYRAPAIEPTPYGGDDR